MKKKPILKSKCEREDGDASWFIWLLDDTIRKGWCVHMMCIVAEDRVWNIMHQWRWWGAAVKHGYQVRAFWHETCFEMGCTWRSKIYVMFWVQASITAEMFLPRNESDGNITVIDI